MDCKLMFFGLIVVFAVSVVGSSGDFVGKNSNGKRMEYLDSNGKYLLEWEAFLDTQTIIFELTVATNGYVGFGISPGGGMTGADIIVGGVYSNGSSYISLWRMTKMMVMPTKTTTYWCTVQKSPPLLAKHHVVGFRPVLETPDALKYTHHFIVHKCRAPEGSTDEDTFERFINQPGADCYVGSQNVPLRYCESYLFVWAVGGKSVTFPEQVGYPFAVDGKPSYYLLEVHFDNPNNVQGVEFETGVEIFYTPELRQYDAGLITAGHATSWAITIPPNAENYTIVGHCSPSCSSNIPASGINVFNILLHSHLAGRKLKLRHFRDGIELPWLSSDDNYNFNYQQNRPLLEDIKVLPGDHITYECTYNSMDANGTIIGGLATTDEMCNTFLWYYPEIDLDVCSSEFPIRELMLDFGIESFRRSSSIQDPIVLAPESMANKSYTEVLNTLIPWTKENLDHLQEGIRYGYHNVVCGIAGREIPNTDTIKYPNITKEYAPIDECARKDTDSSANNQSSLYFMAYIIVMIPLIPWF